MPRQYRVRKQHYEVEITGLTEGEAVRAIEDINAWWHYVPSSGIKGIGGETHRGRIVVEIEANSEADARTKVDRMTRSRPPGRPRGPRLSDWGL